MVLPTVDGSTHVDVGLVRSLAVGTFYLAAAFLRVNLTGRGVGGKECGIRGPCDEQIDGNGQGQGKQEHLSRVKHSSV